MHVRNAKILEEMETGANCARYIIDLITFVDYGCHAKKTIINIKKATTAPIR